MIKYKIERMKHSIRTLKLVIESDDDYEPIEVFIAEIFPSVYPKVIDNTIKGIGIGINIASVSFPNKYDIEIDKINENCVEIYFIDKTIVFPRIIFLKILLSAAIEMLKLQKELGKQEDSWFETMEQKIKELEDYIKNPDFKL